MKKIKLFFFWLKKRIGFETVDFERRCGYFHSELARKGNLVHMESNNGKILIYKIVDISFYRDPSDMIESCKYSLIGIKGNKSIKECSFKEFLKIYEP